jgi:hypothetical protein
MWNYTPQTSGGTIIAILSTPPLMKFLKKDLPVVNAWFSVGRTEKRGGMSKPFCESRLIPLGVL